MKSRNLHALDFIAPFFYMPLHAALSRRPCMPHLFYGPLFCLVVACEVDVTEITRVYVTVLSSGNALLSDDALLSVAVLSLCVVF